VPEDTVVVRTTMQPDTDLQVGASEAASLRRQGLLVPGFDGTEYTGVIPKRRAARTNTPEEGN
jgi:hypothetical protein